MMKMIIEMEALEYRYPDGTMALNGVDISIKRGAKVAFVGPNGSGKSTLFLHLNGILRPFKGEVRFEGRPLEYDRQSLKEVRQKIGMVFQNADDQLFAPQVWQDVAFGPKNRGLPDKEVKVRVEKALRIVGIETLAKKPPHFLSGGQKKRAAIAGILAMDPEVMALDEPIGDLDPEGRDEVVEILEELSHLGKTVIVSTHNVEFAYSWADHVYVMASGTIKAQGTPKKIFSDPALLKSAKLTCPKVVEFYKELCERESIRPNGAPKNLLELLSMLDVPLLRFMEIPRKTKKGDFVNLSCEEGKLKAHKVMDPPFNTKGMGRIIRGYGDRMAAIEILDLEFVKKKIGSVFIYMTEAFERSGFFRDIDTYRIDYIGAMGTRAKLITCKEDITIDWGSDVINRALLKATSGKSTLIITSGGMAEHVKKRVEDYTLESGFDIPVETLNHTLRRETMTEIREA